MIPNSNLSGLPEVTETHMKNNDPSVLNRTLRLLATQINGLQTKIPTVAGITGTAAPATATVAVPTSSGSVSGGTSSSSTITVQGTHAERLSTYLATNEPLGCYFYETDRGVFYLNYLFGGMNTWIWSSGTMYDTQANRPTDLGTNDTGFLYYATDKELSYRWTGSAWAEISVFEPILQDTHANRLSLYPSVYYALVTFFNETDRTSIYTVQNATGTVTVAGGVNVTWVSGNHFINTGTGFNAAQWPVGTPIVIAGVTSTIAAVASPTSLTLQTAVANGVGVSYSVASGRWQYLSGTYEDTFTNLPTDLGENDYISAGMGFQFFDTTHWRLFQWAPTGAAPASASPGWKRGMGELPSLFIGILPLGGGQMTTGWTLCNGNTVSVTYDDASSNLITLPNFSGGAFPKGGTTGTYGPTGATPNPAVVPTISGNTDSATTGISVSSATATTGTALAGATQAVLTALTSGGGAVTDGGHTHPMSPANAPIALPADPVPNIVVPFYLKR